jgi:hypothetical protein
MIIGASLQVGAERAARSEVQDGISLPVFSRKKQIISIFTIIQMKDTFAKEKTLHKKG